MLIKTLVMLLLAGASYALTLALLIFGLADSDWWIAMIVGVYCTILFDSLFFAWDNQRDVEKRAPTLDPDTVYEVARAWNYRKPVLLLTPYGVGPARIIEYADQDCPTGFKGVISSDYSRAFWVPEHMVKDFKP